MKKLLAIVLSLVLLVTAIPIVASAEVTASGECGDNLTWTLEDGVLTISGNGEMYDYDYANRSPWDGYSVYSAIIEDGVTSISNYAFPHYCNLTSIIIPKSVSSIRAYSFHGCQKLSSIVVDEDNSIYYSSGNCLIEKQSQILIKGSNNSIIPDSVTIIGEDAFSGFTGLMSINIPDNVTSIGDFAFYGCSGLTSITIPDSVTSIRNFAFTDCSGLASITIPDSVSVIGAQAFSGCSGLTSITISDNVTSIGSEAFWGCTGLTSITIPSSVTSIGVGTFEHCTGLTSIAIPSSVTSIGEDAFDNCSGLMSITIPDSVTSIGDYAFSRCSGLTAITIPDSVTSIGNYAFSRSNGLTSITIGDSVTSIGHGVFCGCSGLNSINVDEANTIYYSLGNCVIEKESQKLIAGCKTSVAPTDVSSIGDYAFYGCSGLTTFTIPDSVTDIGVWAFSGCASLTSIIILNRDCEVFDSSNTFDFTTTLYGFSESTTEEYAVKYNRNFVPIDDNCEFVGHDYVDHEAKNPTCTAIGWYAYQTCSRCDYSTYVEIEALGHECVVHESNAATCTGAGNSAYYSCSVCDKFFRDEKGLNEIVENSWIIPAHDHNYVLDHIDHATCTEDGTKYFVCTYDENHNYIATITRLGHDYTGSYVVTKAAACTDDGIETLFCAREGCNEVLDTRIIGSSGHTVTAINAKPATQTTPGYTGDKVCSACEVVFATGGIIPAGGILTADQYPDFESGTFEHRNNGSNSDFWYENSAFENGTQLIVSDNPNTEDEEYCAGKNLNHKYKVYDIKAQNGVMLVQPDGVVWIALNLPGNYDANKTQIYYVNSTAATYEKMPCFIKDGKIFFMTTHFSSFAIVDETCLHNSTHIAKCSEATCTCDGYSGDKVCDFCNAVITAGNAINAFGHKDNDGDRICDICGEQMSAFTLKCSRCDWYEANKDNGIYGWLVTIIHYIVHIVETINWLT